MEPVSFPAAILTALPYFISLEAKYKKESDRKRFENEQFGERHYDYIIVGGGTAGCVLANRLSEKFPVLLLEAGGDPPSAASVPAFDDYVSADSDINYLYTTIPQQFANNRAMSKASGKMLGGSGSHNWMMHNRGSPNDFNNWAQILNDSSWTYANLLQYFKKSETYMGIWPINDEHGLQGPFAVETKVDPLDPIWKQTALELGYNYSDPNAPQRPGFSSMEMMRKNGRRVSTYTAYLQPILSIRKNLEIIRYADVYKIIISNGKATGVQYLRHGKPFQSFVSKEVILCAGLIGTPMLLFKSGIGPADMMSEAGIDLILDLPAVGQFIENHPGVLMPPFMVDPSYVSNLQNNLTEVEFEKFLNHAQGHVLSDNRAGGQVFLVSREAEAKNEFNWPDIDIFKGYNYSLVTSNPSNLLYFDVGVGRPEISSANFGKLIINTTAYLLGERDDVKLAVIDDKILHSQRDRKKLLEGVKFIQNVGTTAAFRRVNANETFEPECGSAHIPNSLEYWNCYFQKFVRPLHHAVGSCRMGRPGDIVHSVVDSQFRVHELRTLRIVDASIPPRITNTNINAAIIAISEKAAITILGSQ